MTRATLESAAWVAASRRGVFEEQARTASGTPAWVAASKSGVGERGVPDFLLLMPSRGARVLWVVRLPRCFLWSVLRVPLESALLTYASSSLSFFFHLPFTRSLTRTYVPAPAQSSRFPRDAFFSSFPAPNISASTYSLVSYRTARRSRTFPFPLAESRFPPETGIPPRPVTEGISLRSPIGAESAFPARGMLAHFPHAFARGASRPRSVLSSGHSLPVGSGGVVILLPP
jgi:hypothetical protein